MKLVNDSNQTGTGCIYGIIQEQYRTYCFFKSVITGKIIPKGEYT